MNKLIYAVAGAVLAYAVASCKGSGNPREVDGGTEGGDGGPGDRNRLDGGPGPDSPTAAATRAVVLFSDSEDSFGAGYAKICDLTARTCAISPLATTNQGARVFVNNRRAYILKQRGAAGEFGFDDILGCLDMSNDPPTNCWSTPAILGTNTNFGSMAFSDSDSSAFLTEGTIPNIYVVNTEDGTFGAPISVASPPGALIQGGDYLFVTRGGLLETGKASGAVDVIEKESRQVVKTVDLSGANPVGILYDSGSLYVATQGTLDPDGKSLVRYGIEKIDVSVPPAEMAVVGELVTLPNDSVPFVMRQGATGVAGIIVLEKFGGPGFKANTLRLDSISFGTSLAAGTLQDLAWGTHEQFWAVLSTSGILLIDAGGTFLDGSPIDVGDIPNAIAMIQ